MRILVALDGSPSAPKVLEAAGRLARLTGAKLVLFRAITVATDLPEEVLIRGELRLEDVLRARAHDELERLAAGIDPALIEQIVVELAVPWDGICRAARQRDVDLIAIGSHGYGALDRILGTTAAKVVNHADRNVLVVRTVL
ncbi:MAG TPA: universal stress protein [Kofleriaceae bacterium]|nr:universal stress protein [Kofleriaceae bacterium]